MIGHSRHRRVLALVITALVMRDGVPQEILAGVTATPACRFDLSLNEPVRVTLSHALDVFKLEKLTLPFDEVVVNSETPVPPGWLHVEIVKDATKGQVDQTGCLKHGMESKGEGPLDQFSVPGGCYVSGGLPNLLRCSAGAVNSFMTGSSASRPGSPALLYVLAHELVHFHQNRRGEFSGKIETVDLHKSKALKLQQLERNCAPALITKEEEADNLALTVLKKRLPDAPYKEPLFSAKGSMYWNIDRIRLAASEWDKLTGHQLGLSEVKVHRTFDPNRSIALPASATSVKSASQRFVCDVLKSSKGIIRYPARQSTHPSPEARLRKIADILGGSASQMSETGSAEAYQPIANLQEGVSPIFAFFDREFGIYIEKIHSEVCSAVNGGVTEAMCE